MLVDGRPARRVRGTTFELNSRAGRPLRATVASGRWMSPYPRLLVEGEVYETGPAPPAGLQLLAVVPGLAIFLGGLGMFLAVAGLLASVAVLRRPWPLRARFAGVLAVVAVTAALGWVDRRTGRDLDLAGPGRDVRRPGPHEEDRAAGGVSGVVSARPRRG